MRDEEAISLLKEIDAFYLAFSPMLDTSLHKKLKAIVERLKQM